MLSLLLLPAFADPPDDETVRALASKAMGKEVPEKYLCIERPELTEAFGGDPVPVGIKLKNQGCVLKGVVVEGKWLEPEGALIASVPGWAGLSGDARSDVAIRWARDVLLAFEQPISAGSFEDSAVTLDAAWRIPEPQHAAEGQLKLTFAKDGTVTREELSSQSYRTRLVSRTNKVRGITAEQLVEGLQSKGKLLQECLRQAWADDLTVAGTSRLRWTITGGKTTNVESVGWGTTELLRCYSGVLHQVQWKADGAVDYSLVISRDKTE